MKAKGKKLISLFLIFSLMMLSANLYAKERRGDTLIVIKLDGRLIEGELITVKPNSLLLLDTEGKDVSIDIADINVIRVVKKSKVLLGVGLGFLTGVVFGAIVSIPAVDAASDPSSYYYFVPWVLTVIYGTIGGLACGIIGGFIGAEVGTDETIRIERTSDLYIQATLDKLRKKARIRDYK